MIRKFCKHRLAKTDQRGFVLVLTAIGAFALILLAGFAVDLGSWYLSAAKLQRASDAAALAAASKLPNIEEAKTAANDTYSKNGITNGGDIVINNTITASDIETSATNNSVPTYFLKLIMPNISITRRSFSQQASLAPILGSPFNVLGTGDLTNLGLEKPQNFWLAINGACTPKEDGDYFMSRFDQNKDTTLTYESGTLNFKAATGGRTHCPNPNNVGSTAKLNPDFDSNGYSYYINVPKPPTPDGTVSIKIYNPAFWDKGNDKDSYPDFQRGLPSDSTWALVDMGFDLYDTSNNNVSILPLGHAKNVDANDVRTNTQNGWWELGTIPSSLIAANGGEFRLQVFNYQGYASANEGEYRGVNAFSIGAFASWNDNGAVKACDTRNDPNHLCPRVYGRNAISVLNHFSSTSSQSSTSDFYFAQIDPSLAGDQFKVMLWDPGEGVQSMQLLAPDETKLSFTFTASDGGIDSPTTQTDTINTDIQDPNPRARLTNGYEYNDRLLTLTVTIPTNYATMVKPGDNWLRIRYNVNGSPDDRTTWGIATSQDSGNGPPHLLSSN